MKALLLTEEEIINLKAATRLLRRFSDPGEELYEDMGEILDKLYELDEEQNV